MKKYTIFRVADKADWSKIPVISIDTPYENTPASIEATAQIAYNDEALLVRLWTKEENYRAILTGMLDEPCEDSCLEFFFSGSTEDPRYLNLEFNPNGCLYLGLGDMEGNPRLIRLLAEPEEVFAPVITRGTDNWSIEYRIPFTFIRYFFPDFQPEQGSLISANCYKCADCSEPPHYLSWNPVTWGELCLHRRDQFGIMQFQ